MDLDQQVNKIYETLDYVVYPSNIKSIDVKLDEKYNGAHTYFVKKCLGFNNGNTEYLTINDVNNEIKIQFIQKHEDGFVTPGLQNEQLIYILLDRDLKLNNQYPHETYLAKKECLEKYLDLCKERIDDRIQRNVMGKLEK